MQDTSAALLSDLTDAAVVRGLRQDLDTAIAEALPGPSANAVLQPTASNEASRHVADRPTRRVPNAR